MFYQIQVYPDGDIYVTKRHSKNDFDGLLYLSTLEALEKELADYDVENVAENIQSIKDAAINEEVRCY